LTWKLLLFGFCLCHSLLIVLLIIDGKQYRYTLAKYVTPKVCPTHCCGRFAGGVYP
jgi:hypothetical protein